MIYLVNIMCADILAMQGVGASATEIFTVLRRINSVSTRQGFYSINQIGIMHITAPGYNSYFDFARVIIGGLQVH